MKLTNKSTEKITALKMKGWNLKEITQIYENDSVSEINVVFINKSNGTHLTINTKNKTIFASAAVSFEDVCHFAEIALEGGFEVEG